jgi:hypothetical protein
MLSALLHQQEQGDTPADSQLLHLIRSMLVILTPHGSLMLLGLRPTPGSLCVVPPPLRW